MPFFAQQSRAARGWLHWTQADLAAAAHVSLTTVRDFELDRRAVPPSTVVALREAMEDAGLKFGFFEDRGFVGVK